MLRLGWQTPLISASIQAQAAALAQQAAVLAQYRQGQAHGQPAAGVQVLSVPSSLALER
jgi:hypothetical protein